LRTDAVFVLCDFEGDDGFSSTGPNERREGAETSADEGVDELAPFWEEVAPSPPNQVANLWFRVAPELELYRRTPRQVAKHKRVKAAGAPAGTNPTKPGAPAGTPADRALAREASRILQRVGPAALLRPALEATDPEVRAIALEAAGESPQLCAALSDPWETLRLAAVRGLSRLPGEADCLAAALNDTSPAVRGAAVGALGDAQVKAAVPALRKVAGDATGPVLVRAEALAVLGRLGDLGPARTVLETHLDKGGIVPLALGSIAALAESKEPADRARLRRVLDSKEGAVAARAAHALALLGDKESLDALRALRTRLGPRHRDEVDQALEMLGVAPAGEADPADLDDE
jgi:hypothetical protein